MTIDDNGPQPSSGPATFPVVQVEVVRSPRRRKTVQAREVNGVLRVSIPASMTKADEEHWVAEMLRRMQRRHPLVGVSTAGGEHADEGDPQLERRARGGRDAQAVLLAERAPAQCRVDPHDHHLAPAVAKGLRGYGRRARDPAAEGDSHRHAGRH